MGFYSSISPGCYLQHTVQPSVGMTISPPLPLSIFHPSPSHPPCSLGRERGCNSTAQKELINGDLRKSCTAEGQILWFNWYYFQVTSVNYEMMSARTTTQDLQGEFPSCTNNQTARATLDRLSQEIQDATTHITSNITKIQEKLDGDLIDSFLQSSSSIRQYHFWG